MLRERDLGVLGGHSQYGRHPHPEESPRAAPMDGDGDTGDVSDPDGRGQSGRQSLEVGNVAWFIGVVVDTRRNREPGWMPSTASN